MRDSIERSVGAPLKPYERIERAIRHAHEELRRAMLSNNSLGRMATTVVSLLLDRADDSAVISHVGDSRAYRLRRSRLERLTGDHSLAAQMVAEGLLDPAAAKGHPYDHVLTRALNTNDDVDFETRQASARSGDVFLLCTDGLTKMLDDGEIRSCLREADGLRDAGQQLIRTALGRGGDDNVTVVLVEIP